MLNLLMTILLKCKDSRLVCISAVIVLLCRIITTFPVGFFLQIGRLEFYAELFAQATVHDVADQFRGCQQIQLQHDPRAIGADCFGTEH